MNLDEAYAAYVNEILVFERTWWIEDNEVLLRCTAAPDLQDRLVELAEQMQLVSTRHVYHEGRAWTSARQQVQARVVDALIPPIRHDASAPPFAFFILGMPASGKSTMLRRIAAAFAGAQTGAVYPVMTADADDIRKAFVEYRRGAGSRVVQDEVVDVSYPGPHAPPAALYGSGFSGRHRRSVIIWS
jgi:pantothenate kinase